MLVLALDTTTRRGSAALSRDGVVLDCDVGDPALTYGQRLPGDLVRLLGRHTLGVGDVDLFAVAAGPGSFTGIRIGIATMQGLALANGRPLAGVSALDALNASEKGTGSLFPDDRSKKAPGTFFVGVWMDAQRGQVFSALYQGDRLLDGPCVDTPADTLSRWRADFIGGSARTLFVGDGALAYAALIRERLPQAAIDPDVPALASAVARLAEVQAERGDPLPPEAIRPIYVRRPDVELARDRKQAGQ
jgi:tRNA threonylcarbamoyladenosine biosynthesis protein TsaB